MSSVGSGWKAMDEYNLFREAFSLEVARQIGQRMHRAWPSFDVKRYAAVLSHHYEELGYGDRARRIVEALEQTLPSGFQQAAAILCDSLDPEPSSEAELTGFDGFYVVPLTMYVSRHGMNDPDTSLHALYEMTKRFSAESEIRPFIVRYPEKTMAFLTRLCSDPSPFARRLASEGTRPRLPLAGRLPEFQKDPGPVISLIERLVADPSPMVRRSVANNINDISKDNPDRAVATLGRWRELFPRPETEALIRHGLRTLIKQSHPGALELLGFRTLGLTVEEWSINGHAVRLGEGLAFRAVLRSDAVEHQSLAINYIVHFIKASGRRKPKVFRMPDKVLEAGKRLELTRTHVFRDCRNQTFRSGLHRIELSVNGVVVAGTDFVLEVPDHTS
jgi:3-methyladenine DNA glycosylase AlkC